MKNAIVTYFKNEAGHLNNSTMIAEDWLFRILPIALFFLFCQLLPIISFLRNMKIWVQPR